MNEPLIDGARIDEGLQRGARRAAASRAIDLTVDRLIEKISGTRLREHFHRTRVDQHRSGIGDSPRRRWDST